MLRAAVGTMRGDWEASTEERRTDICVLFCLLPLSSFGKLLGAIVMN